jgi:hypothetical protein
LSNIFWVPHVSSPAQLRRSAEKFLPQRLSVREAQNRKSSDDRNHLSFKILVPEKRFELPTFALRMRCSTS